MHKINENSKHESAMVSSFCGTVACNRKLVDEKMLSSFHGSAFTRTIFFHRKLPSNGQVKSRNSCVDFWLMRNIVWREIGRESERQSERFTERKKRANKSYNNRHSLTQQKFSQINVRVRIACVFVKNSKNTKGNFRKK